MTPEQLEKLNALQEKLFAVVAIECDPENWPGAGVMPCDMTKEERGNTQWVRKNAAQVLSMFARIDDIRTRLRSGDDLPRDFDPEADIARAEKAANAALRRVIGADA